MKFKEQFDLWSGWHFLGSYVLASWLFKEFGIKGIVGAFTLGLIWELMDSMYAEVTILKSPRGEFWDNVFDSRGFSYVDLAFDFLGCLLFYLWSIV